MARPARFGLRAQLVIALSIVLLASFVLLALAALRLTLTAADREQAKSAERALSALGRATSGGVATAGFDAAVAAYATEISARAFRIERASPDGAPSVTEVGSVPKGPGVTVPLAHGTRVTIWPGPVSAQAYGPLANLLVFYVMLTGAAVLVLMYFALTRLIVRPLDRLTASTELIALAVRDRAPLGSLDARVPEEGAAEVAQLASSFNAMGEQLKKDRAALVARLQELEATTNELRGAQQQVIHGEKLASVGRLAAGVAHEIGNPLAAILGLVELLQTAELPADERAEFLTRIHKETERIHQIIRDLLDFARRDAEAEANETADVAQAVQDAVGLVRHQKESREVVIRVAIDPAVGLVRGASHRLTQVVLNLLLNAVDALFGQKGAEVVVSAEALPGGQCLLAVSDNGPGIAAEMLDRLFEPFATTKPPGKGTGLGLAVSHTLVEAMGGRITAKNQESGGARFEVRLQVPDRG
jgi:C4-dicarboxylate-specific signal transduction histidine kinase